MVRLLLSFALLLGIGKLTVVEAQPSGSTLTVPPQEAERIRQILASVKATVEIDPRLSPQAPLLVRCPTANDALLLKLAQFPQVGGIHIADGRLCTAKGYAALKTLPQLRKLVVEHAVLSPASLAAITECAQLRHLSLIDAGLTDASITPLKALTRLEHLNLSQNPKITDAGLKTIITLERLQSLHLAHCRITDKGLMQLEALEALRTLNVVQTAVSTEALERLTDAMPNLRNVRR
jgi:Leucine-rich repeat (LRR) protein